MVLPLFGLLAGTALLGQAYGVPWVKQKAAERQGRLREGLLAGIDPADEEAQANALMRGGLLDPNDFFTQMRGFDQNEIERERLGESRRQFDARYAFDVAGRNTANEQQTAQILGSVPTEYLVPTSDPAMIDYAMGALANMESGGNYSAMGPETGSGDRAYGKYQIMGANIPSWTEAALGVSMTPQEFLADPDAQEATARYHFSQYAAKEGIANAVSRWHSGRDLATAAGQGAADVNLSTVDYTSRVLGLTGQNVATAKQQNDPIWQEAQVRGEPWLSLDPKVREDILNTETALATIEDTIDYLDDTTGVSRSMLAGGSAEREEFKTRYMLTVLPTLQALFQAGAMQEGELELFQKFAGNGFDLTQLTAKEQSKMKGVLAIVEAQMLNQKQSLGLTDYRPDPNPLPPGAVAGAPPAIAPQGGPLAPVVGAINGALGRSPQAPPDLSMRGTDPDEFVRQFIFGSGN